MSGFSRHLLQRQAERSELSGHLLADARHRFCLFPLVERAVEAIPSQTIESKVAVPTDSLSLQQSNFFRPTGKRY